MLKYHQRLVLAADRGLCRVNAVEMLNMREAWDELIKTCSLYECDFKLMEYSFSDTGDNHMVIEFPAGSSCGWESLILRLNTYYGDFINAEFENPGFKPLPGNKTARISITETDILKLDAAFKIMSKVIQRKEYIFPERKHQRYYDLKLGYSCNNNCIHCVIKPNLVNFQREDSDSIILDSGIGMQCTRDLSYPDIISLFRSKDFENVGRLTITGGEPTIRKDLINILKWLYYNRPDIQISIQTNGRFLSNYDFAREIRRYSRAIGFVFAIHGNEETHNFIVNNRKDEGNPYQETVQGLRNVLSLFSKRETNIRIETVLSKYNYNEAYDVIREFHEQYDIEHAGISYPHLEGFAPDKVREIAPVMKDLVPMLKALNDYAHEHCDLLIEYEEIPDCIHRQYTSSLKLGNMGIRWDGISVNYLGEQMDDFYKVWLRCHSKALQCENCIKNNSCIGVWWENLEINLDSIIPIKQEV